MLTMKKYIILCISFFTNLVFGLLSYDIFKFSVLLVTNTTKGKVNNPDGELFIPVGFIIPVICFLTIIVLNRYTYTRANIKMSTYIIINALFIILGLVCRSFL